MDPVDFKKAVVHELYRYLTTTRFRWQTGENSVKKGFKFPKDEGWLRFEYPSFRSNGAGRNLEGKVDVIEIRPMRYARNHPIQTCIFAYAVKVNGDDRKGNPHASRFKRDRVMERFVRWAGETYVLPRIVYVERGVLKIARVSQEKGKQKIEDLSKYRIPRFR